MGQPAQNPSRRFGVFELDMRSGELRKAGTRVRLQEQPLKVLIALLDQPGTVVTREQLKRLIWPEDSFGDFDHAVNVAVAKLRAALSDSADTPRYVETLPRRGYRFIFPVTPAIGRPQPDGAEAAELEQTQAGKEFTRLQFVAIAVIAFVFAASIWWLIHSRKPKMLTDKDTLVLADFENTTGDSVFDGTIRQGLAVQLEQSPFLSLISDAAVKQTLRLMNQPADARLTADIAQQVCIRTGSAALLNGSIAKLGNQYVLGLKATNCTTGDSLVEEQVTSERKEEVLDALAQAASRLRARLGESVGTIQKYNTPLEQVTTPSLQALHVYSLGRTTLIDKEDEASAIQLFERAIQLDPNFAMAYASLGLAYGEYFEEEAISNFRKAYELREHVSERERFYIEAHYHQAVTGDWEAAREVYGLWSQLYPRDDIPHLNLSEIDSSLGEYENARKESAESLRLLPGDCPSYGALAGSLLRLDRLDEAHEVMKTAEQQKAGCFHLQFVLYEFAFLKNDTQEMDRITRASADRWPMQSFDIQAQSAAYFGRLREARDRVRRLTLSARQSDHEELGALLEVSAAESEALFGNLEIAQKEVRGALARSNARDFEGVGALTLALAHDEAGARSLANDLAKRFPQSTLVQTTYLPCVRAQLALNHRDTRTALEDLQMSIPYELGSPKVNDPLLRIYLRGQAYLMARSGSKAAAEFQKILDHRGIVLNSPTGALARLQIARAYTLQGETDKARVAYQDFITLWKDAEPDIPILKQAKAEYAKLL
jgi:eukaryotic-like serine/threonine-protein kinase